MVAAPGRDVQRPEHLLILDISSGNRKNLRPESEFSQFARCRVGLHLALMFVDSSLPAFKQLRIYDAPRFDRHKTDSAVFELQRELARSARWHVINFACRQICYIRTTTAEAVAFLRLLPAQIMTQAEPFFAVSEVDLYPVGSRHAESKFLCIPADLVVVDG